MGKLILFVSDMDGDPWGGSEELWTRAAIFLAKQGLPTAASVHGWPKLAPQIKQLATAGVDLRPRPFRRSIIRVARRYASGKAPLLYDVERAFGRKSPSLVVLSTGFFVPRLELVELCAGKGWPFVTVSQCNSASWWVSDEQAARFRKVLPLARRCYFISEANKTLAQRQLGSELDNGEIIANPIIVDKNTNLPWPEYTDGEEIHMACVGRLDIAPKGQDILLDVLSQQSWKARCWRLTFYGNGPNRDYLMRLAATLGLSHKVFFAGHVPVETIWRDNHILIMPSRFEGWPMTTVEAMWCGRPVVATNVGLNPDVIKDGLTGFLAESASIDALGNALERMWGQRHRLEDIGKQAIKTIREYLPDDPVRVFAEKLQSLAATS
jgi:glycosyltransferase involved in cell wall biosynthesis